MIKHTLIDKCCTIIENSEFNTGLNPVAELNVGDFVSRILLHFDITKLRESVKNGEINTSNLKHYIKMTNCGSVNLPIFNSKNFVGCKIKERAVSFDIIAFKIPFQWDEGRGFDYYGDYGKDSHSITSKDASNWFQAKNGVEWDEDGVYFNKTLAKDYFENFGFSTDGIVIGRQHFDNGTEDLYLDITNYINQLLNNNEEFFGIGLSFSPRYESNTVDNKFISFFTNNTNTFFLPYVETIDSNIVLDDRANFYIGKKNRLYFFVKDDGEFVNLDIMPTCTINDKEYNVQQNGKGCYYVEVTLNGDDVEENTILYDNWSNLILNGNKINDVELDFVALPMSDKIKIGKVYNNEVNIIPQLYGIKQKEQIKNGDIREIFVEFIEEFSYGKKTTPSFAEYKIYVKENDREIIVYPYQTIERRYTEHSFIIDTNELIPNTYHVDIKIKNGKTIKHFENVLEFDIISNVTNFYK